MGMGRKSRYSLEEKLEAVLSVVEDYHSMQSVAEKTGIDKKEIRRWTALYKHHGKDGLSIRNGHYSVEFKLSVIRHMEKNNLSLLKTAVMFSIPDESVIRKWKRIYNEKGAAGFIQGNLYRNEDMNSNEKSKLKEKTKEELIKELEYLRMENAYLKKLQALVQARKNSENGKNPKPSKN